MDIGVLMEDLVGGCGGGTAVVVVRLDTAGLPADVERTDGVCSTKFRPN